MQQLYENHKIVTYPRTDSHHISEDIVATLPERLKSIAQGPYVALARGIPGSKCEEIVSEKNDATSKDIGSTIVKA